jgi:molybdenum cofactor cytidylyltransferase
MKVTALLLAAGYARRFGSDKRLLPATAGQSLVEYTLSRYQQVFDCCAVLVRDGDPVHAIVGRLPNVIVIPQPAPQAGLGDNIALAMGVAEILQGDAVAIALADMPLVQIETLRRLRDLARRDRIFCPFFERKRGHPVIFGAQYFAELSRLAGDTGARRILSSARDQVVDIDVDDVGVLADVDTPADWERIRASFDVL